MTAKQASGGSRMAATGRVHVSLWLDPADAALIDQVRGTDPRTKFLIDHGISAAKKILKKSEKKG